MADVAVVIRVVVAVAVEAAVDLVVVLVVCHELVVIVADFVVAVVSGIVVVDLAVENVEPLDVLDVDDDDGVGVFVRVPLAVCSQTNENVGFLLSNTPGTTIPMVPRRVLPRSSANTRMSEDSVIWNSAEQAYLLYKMIDSDHSTI